MTGEIIDLSAKRKPVAYTVDITHHWDDRLEVFVHDVSDDERSCASVADALSRAAQMFQGKTEMPDETKTSTAAALLAMGDAAKFTAGALADQAYERSVSGVDQIAQLAVVEGWALFAENCTQMGLKLQGDA